MAENRDSSESPRLRTPLLRPVCWSKGHDIPNYGLEPCRRCAKSPLPGIVGWTAIIAVMIVGGIYGRLRQLWDRRQA